MNKRVPWKKLQAMIDRTTAAANRFHVAQSQLNDWCQDFYGVEPGDIDADSIIDAVMGGCGVSSGMTAAAFHEAMGGEDE